MQSRNRHIAKVLLINGADRTRKNKVRQINSYEWREVVFCIFASRREVVVSCAFIYLSILLNQDGKTPLDLSMCYGKDFKSYDLAKLLKLVPLHTREFWLENELSSFWSNLYNNQWHVASLSFFCLWWSATMSINHNICFTSP